MLLHYFLSPLPSALTSQMNDNRTGGLSAMIPERRVECLSRCLQCIVTLVSPNNNQWGALSMCLFPPGLEFTCTIHNTNQSSTPLLSFPQSVNCTNLRKTCMNCICISITVKCYRTGWHRLARAFALWERKAWFFYILSWIYFWFFSFKCFIFSTVLNEVLIHKKILLCF